MTVKIGFEIVCLYEDFSELGVYQSVTRLNNRIYVAVVGFFVEIGCRSIFICQVT